MKQLLCKRKKALIIYIFACLLPMARDIFRAGVFALIFKSIEIGEIGYFKKVLFIGIGFLIFCFISYISSRLLRISYMRDTILDVRIAAFDRIVNMSYRQFNKHSKEVYISNLINDVNNFEKNFFISLLNFIYSSSTYLVSGIIIFILDYRLGIIIVSASIIIFIFTKLMEKRTIVLHEESSNKNEQYTVNLANTLNGLEIIKINNIENIFLHNNLKAVDDLEKSKFRFNIYNYMQRQFVWSIGSLVLIGMLLFLLTSINKGASFGSMSMIIVLSSNMTFGLRNILPRINVIKSSSRIYKKITSNEGEKTVNKSHNFIFNGRIEVKDLHFSYDNKLIFDNANCVIEKDKKYLIKGASGAGKSTLIKILTNSYDDYHGLVTVDGIDLKDIRNEGYDKDVAYIYQDVFLFEDSLKNNITLYKNINDEQINNAIEKSGLAEFVSELPEGINHVLSENGKNLSGGQRQRVSIARAIAKEANLLFVDEGTSSLNMELGMKIEETFLNFPGTVLSISHRYYEGVSNKYDYVLEIKNGKINTYTAKDYFQEDLQYV